MKAFIKGLVAEARLKSIEILLALVGLVIGAWWIPNTIDAHAADRQRQSDCFRSVVDLRRSAEQLGRGYAINPEVRQERLADLDSVNLNLMSVKFACDRVSAQGSNMDGLNSLIGSFKGVRDGASKGQESPTFSSDVISWTDRSMQSK